MIIRQDVEEFEAMKAERIQEEKDNRRKVEAENKAMGKEDYRQREPEQAGEEQHILTQLATSNILEEKERTRKDEADEQRRQDGLIEFEAQQKEKADKEEEESRKAGTAGASGAITRSTEKGTDLTGENIRLHMIRHNRCNQQNYSASDLKEKISELDPNATFKTGTHEKWHVEPCFKKKGVDALLNGFA